MATFTTHKMRRDNTRLDQGVARMKADKTYYLDSTGELTTEEPSSGFVLINEGQEIPKEMADRYGVGKVATVEEEVAEEKTVKSAKPTKNKSMSPKANK